MIKTFVVARATYRQRGLLLNSSRVFTMFNVKFVSCCNHFKRPVRCRSVDALFKSTTVPHIFSQNPMLQMYVH